MNKRSEAVIRVTVFGHSELEVCLVSGCGAEVCSVQTTEELRAAMQALFGDRVAVSHYDLAQPELAERFAEVLQGARDRNLPFPLTAINGDIVLAGPVSVETVLRKLGEIVAPDVLLIEDAWRFRALIKAQLMELGLEVLRVPTLEAGVKLLSVLGRSRPRLVVADTVGQRDAAVLLPQLRAVAEDIPIILCTGPYDETLLNINTNEWEAVLVRPFTIGELATKVTQLLEGHDA